MSNMRTGVVRGCFRVLVSTDLYCGSALSQQLTIILSQDVPRSVLVFIQKNRFVEDTPSSLLAVEYGSRVRLFMRGYFVLKNGKCPKRHAFMFELSFQGTVVFVVFVFR